MRIVGALVAAFMMLPPVAWADHGGPVRTAGWSPMAAALLFGGLALLAGMLVVVIVALLTRRDRNRPSS